MTTSAKSTFGVALSRDGNDIAELTSVSSPEVTLETIDVTSHDSADSFREFIGGLLDGGEMNIEGNFLAGDSDGQIGLLTDMLAKTVQSFVMTWPTSLTATYTFSALVTKFKVGDYTVDGKQTFTATLKITGKPVLAITAASAATDIVVTGNVSGALAEIPTFAGTTYEYMVDGSAEATVTITVTAASADTITVNGSAVESGVASSAITLEADDITTITVVVGETGKVSRTYVVKISN